MIRIFVDSSADFEPQELEQLQLECIPLPVMFGETVYQENVNLTKDEFYRLLTTGSDFPHTSRPTPHDLTKRLKQARDHGDDMIVITLSSALSGTYQDIVMAARNCHYDRCFVIDSRNATGGIRLLAQYAAQLRDEDETAEYIVDAVKALRKRIRLYACLDTLEYLQRGGRISGAAAAIGTVARIKPIIQIDSKGRVDVTGKMLGMNRGQMHLIEQFEAHPADPAFPVVMLYTMDQTNADHLAERMAKHGYDTSTWHRLNVGAVIGSHIGPGAVGFVYVEKEAE